MPSETTTQNVNHLPADMEEAFRCLRLASRSLRALSSEAKNRSLLAIADDVALAESEILSANADDLKRLNAEAAPAYRDRLTLTSARIKGMVESLRQVAALPDPVNEVVEERILENGLRVRRVRSPLGTIFMIFESRPNVILEAFSLAFKTGNAIALRGGKESAGTATVLYALIKKALARSGVNETSFYGMNDYDRSHVEKLLKRKDIIDIVVPRGGEKLIAFVEETSLMPIIKNDRGLCHAYIDESADLEMAVRIVENGKTQRPGVCNSLETVLVHRSVAEKFLPMLYKATAAKSLEWKVDESSRTFLTDMAHVSPASDKDWDTEHLEMILNCKIVESVDEAITHIERHGSRHSETIITANASNARYFQTEVDAAAVYWNASTRFTDGFELGLGGELGISTQKLHVRGPVGLRELTTPRWIIDGTGQIRRASALRSFTCAVRWA
ncbi:MAG: glutamate-5-semialdehyde dehydrogenase [Proteobacteria bacterium]|nr:MAG: glutamate-5-semialdehyde dehydrogenase [Pseudomonadota bacterium]